MKTNPITGNAQTVTNCVERAMNVLKDRAEPRPRAKPTGRRWQDRQQAQAKPEGDSA